MSNIDAVFGPEAKVVISPDQMRAWVILPPPEKGPYTPEAITQWLPRHGVVFGVDPAMVNAAAESRRYRELLEVARGIAPTPPQGADYRLTVSAHPFTGLRANSDGSLQYDDFSFLTTVEENQILAEITPARPGKPGVSVTGEELLPPAPGRDRVLEGSGFVLAADGLSCLAPRRSHISLVENSLIVTPLLQLDEVTEEMGPIDFEGSILVNKDVHRHSSLKATGSIYVVGRADSSSLEAGRNILLGKGATSHNGFCTIKAAENVWGMGFEGCDITAGRDICANHLIGCDASCGGKANVLGGRALIAATTLRAENGVLAGTIGGGQAETRILCGANAQFVATHEAFTKKLDKLSADLQGLQQNITAAERINRSRPDKGANDAKYKEMVARRAQMINVQQILEKERTRARRRMEQYSAVSVIARVQCAPPLVVEINNRAHTLNHKMEKVKFRYNGEAVEPISLQSSR